MIHRLHDLLCPVDKSQAQQIELQGRWVDPGSVVCICERLQRVREDERGKNPIAIGVEIARKARERALDYDDVWVTQHGDRIAWEWKGNTGFALVQREVLESLLTKCNEPGYAAALRDCQRFLEKVDTSGDCWMWLGSRNHDGYGRVQWNGKTESAHRVSASLFLGPIPDGAHVLHTCDNPGCVRPTHLFYGDAFVNMQDMAAKGRQALQRNPEQAKAINANGKRKWRTPKKDICKNGHPLTGDNVRIGKNGNGQDYQVCVTCARERSLAAYHRRKEQP